MTELHIAGMLKPMLLDIISRPFACVSSMPTHDNSLGELAKLLGSQLDSLQRVLADIADDLCIGSQLHPNAPSAVWCLCRLHWNLQTLPFPVYCECHDLVWMYPAATVSHIAITSCSRVGP